MVGGAAAGDVFELHALYPGIGAFVGYGGVGDVRSGWLGERGGRMPAMLTPRRARMMKIAIWSRVTGSRGAVGGCGAAAGDSEVFQLLNPLEAEGGRGDVGEIGRRGVGEVVVAIDGADDEDGHFIAGHICGGTEAVVAAAGGDAVLGEGADLVVENIGGIDVGEGDGEFLGDGGGGGVGGIAWLGGGYGAMPPAVRMVAVELEMVQTAGVFEV